MAYRYGGELTIAREAERREAAKNQPKAPPANARKPCGTTAAYTRHIRKHEPRDDACKAAAREKAADWKARKREDQQGVTPCGCAHAWATHGGEGCTYGDRPTNPEPACDCTEQDPRA